MEEDERDAQCIAVRESNAPRIEIGQVEVRQIEIRRMRAGDVPEVFSLARQVPEAPRWPEAVFVEYAEDAARHADGALEQGGWVAEEPAIGRIAGFVLGRVLRLPGGGEGELEAIAVRTEARGRRCGSRLIRQWIAWARSTGAETLRLEVRASNAAALRLYERAGFVRAGVRSGYYRDPAEDAILFALGFPRAEPL
jgi:ribosomal protein S18 acetylase RimI-like enzyme